MSKSSARISAPRGAADTLPAESWKWQLVESIARQTAALYHFGEIRTPVFERTELFHRGVGETTDIVTKETFTFTDRGGESMTLRPEGTAGVVRAAIENGLLSDEGARAKVYYIGPNFRFERPQKGRLRIHHQFGAEAFGVAAPEQDVECILLQLDFYRRCGLKDLELRVNTLGDGESKRRYRDALVETLSPVASSLSEDSQRRLTTNPLRILDSKDPRDADAFARVSIPASFDFLSDKSKAHWQRVIELLKLSGVAYREDGALVRGFDYYTDTLWEVTAAGLGAQNAVGGGGRYDNLVEQLGGRPTPGVGFGSGIERLLIALESQGVALAPPRSPLVWLVSQSAAAQTYNWKLLGELRAAGIAADLDPSGRSMKAQMKAADRENAAWCIIVGDSELQSNQVGLKNLQTKEQQSVPREQIVERLKAHSAA